MYAVLHVADFALQAVVRTDPTLAGRALALASSDTKKSVIFQVSFQARAAGVEPGMSPPQALARCASLTLRTPLPAAEMEARAALLAVASTLSPAVEDTAGGVCTIDFRGADPLQHVAEATRAVTQLSELGLRATAGIARTPLLALYAARKAEQVDLDAFRTRTNRPNTLKISTARLSVGAVRKIDEEDTFLSPLPLDVADPSPQLSAILASWGLRTLGDLTALPRDEIVRRFGAEGLALYKRACGGEVRPLRLVVPAQEFSAHMDFEHSVETLEPLLFILRRFLDRLTLELRTTHHVAAEIDLTLLLENETSHTRRFRLPEPTGDAEILFRALHTHLETLRTDASILRVHLRLAPVRSLVRQRGLFETGLRDPHGFAETLARVAVLFGSENVGTPQLEDTHRADAVKLVPPLAVIPPLADAAVHAPAGLPLRRFRPPLPVKLELTEHQPTYLWSERFQGAIAGMRGPWQSSGEWWQNDRAWTRTEWDIALAEGGLYRLVRVDGAYFIEGEYD